MALPREPRQKMINMMYLVLTALLALNVSSEILNAFKTVNRSLENTNVVVDKSTSTLLKSFEDKMADPSTRAKAELWYPRAQQAQRLAKGVYDYIQALKNEIMQKAGGDINKKNFKADNLDIATRMFVDKGKGKELKTKLDEFKNQILDINDSIKLEFQNTLPINTEIPPNIKKSNRTFDRAYFHMVPTVAALTILSKFQNDVKTTENRVIQFCHNKVGEVIVRFDTYAAIVGQSSTYLMPGQELEITAGVGAFSKAALPQITIAGQNITLDQDGVARLKTQAGGVGSRSVPVRIVYTDQDGKQQMIEKNVEYVVGSANASIALDKMNVLYIGVQNPITISASGGGDEKVIATIAGGGGSLQKLGGGKYIANVSSVTDNCRITVTVDGKVVGAADFRVRTIPEAQAFVGGQPSGANITAGAFRAQGGVSAGIKNFPFELQYTVVSYTFTCDTDDGDIVSVNGNGNSFDGPVRTAINTHVKPGKLVTIDNIRVKQPDGRTATAPSLIYYIK